jgi:hypothetical protein
MQVSEVGFVILTSVQGRLCKRWSNARSRDRAYIPACSRASQVTRNRTVGKFQSRDNRSDDDSTPPNVSPHLLNLAKCSRASSKGNGLPTNVTPSCPFGNIEGSWFAGLLFIIQLSAFVKGRTTEKKNILEEPDMLTPRGKHTRPYSSTK